MFTSKEQKKEADKISNSTNVIGKGTVIEGNIETHGNIRVEGKITGQVKSKAKVVLGVTGRIQGDVVSNNADIEGEVNGKIKIAETLVLKSTSVIHGDITTSRFVVESGATLNGSCKMGALVRDIKGDNGQNADLLKSEIAKSG